MVLKKFLLMLLVIAILPASASELIGRVKVISVQDGDTATVRLAENDVKIRLYGIDCHETSKIHRAYKQAYLDRISIDEVINNGKLAKQELKNLIENQTVKLEVIGIDKYGRMLGIIYKDGLNINQYLVKKNFCSIYTY